MNAPVSRRTAFAPALALFFLAPFVGEFLLGDLPITFLPALIALAPMYGGGALLVREAAVRMKAGWPGVLLLGLAYGVIEEGLVDQSLFNPHYLGLRLLDYGYVPALGIGLWWTIYVLGLHLIWSTSASIGLAQALWPRRAAEPWLGKIMLPVAVVVFLIGLVAVGRSQAGSFMASPAQLASSAGIAILLAIVAYLIGRRGPAAETPGKVPHPLALGALALVLLLLFLLSAIGIGRAPAWADAGGMLLLLAILGGLVWRWSRRAGWTPAHELALVAGALATYALWSFHQVPPVGHVSPTLDLIGNVIFTALAAALLCLAWRRLPREG